MLYQSLKLTNGIWVLAELKIQPPNTNFVVIYILLCSVFTSLQEEFINKDLLTYIQIFEKFKLRTIWKKILLNENNLKLSLYLVVEFRTLWVHRFCILYIFCLNIRRFILKEYLQQSVIFLNESQCNLSNREAQKINFYGELFLYPSSNHLGF